MKWIKLLFWIILVFIVAVNIELLIRSRSGKLKSVPFAEAFQLKLPDNAKNEAFSYYHGETKWGLFECENAAIQRFLELNELKVLPKGQGDLHGFFESLLRAFPSVEKSWNLANWKTDQTYHRSDCFVTLTDTKHTAGEKRVLLVYWSRKYIDRPELESEK